MLNPASPIARLLDAPMRPGVVRWIAVRPSRRAPMQALTQADLDPAFGLAGDHYRAGYTGKRQVTLIGDLDLVAIGRCLGLEQADAAQHRRQRHQLERFARTALPPGQRRAGGDRRLPPLFTHGGDIRPRRL